MNDSVDIEKPSVDPKSFKDVVEWEKDRRKLFKKSIIFVGCVILSFLIMMFGFAYKSNADQFAKGWHVLLILSISTTTLTIAVMKAISNESTRENDSSSGVVTLNELFDMIIRVIEKVKK